MSARSRLVRGFGATALGPITTALVQVVSVPAFLRAWGPHLYGEWLILSAVPTYLSISDLGMGTAAGNEMTMSVARGDTKDALAIFQSTWALLLGLSSTAAFFATGAILLLPLKSWLGISSLDATQTRLTLAFLSIYALLSLQSSLLISGFRSDRKYASGVFGMTMLRLLENLAMLLLVSMHQNPVMVAFAAVALRVIGTVIMICLLKHMIPWVEFSFRLTSWERIASLLKPAFAFVAFPAGNALSIQGMTILIGLALGPVAVATFTPMRTLSRFAFQIIESIKNATWPELSAAYGASNWPLARKLHRASCLTAFWLALGAVFALAFTGPTLFRIWTHGRVTMDFPCFLILLAVVVANSLWNTSSAVSLAANRHERLAILYLLATSLSLLIAWILTPYLAMRGPALALLLADIFMACFVLPRSNNLLKDDTRDFIRSMMNIQGLKALLAH